VPYKQNYLLTFKFNMSFHFKGVRKQILACEKRERCDLIKTSLRETACSTSPDVAQTHMIFLVRLLRD